MQILRHVLCIKKTNAALTMHSRPQWDEIFLKLAILFFIKCMMYAIIYIVRPIPTIRIQEPQEKKIANSKIISTCCHLLQANLGFKFHTSNSQKISFLCSFQCKAKINATVCNYANGKPLSKIFFFI